MLTHSGKTDTIQLYRTAALGGTHEQCVTDEDQRKSALLKDSTIPGEDVSMRFGTTKCTIESPALVRKGMGRSELTLSDVRLSTHTTHVQKIRLPAYSRVFLFSSQSSKNDYLS